MPVRKRANVRDIGGQPLVVVVVFFAPVVVVLDIEYTHASASQRHYPTGFLIVIFGQVRILASVGYQFLQCGSCDFVQFFVRNSIIHL